jgi:catechol 2,3-dioxygenase-like lactoylglutathione lyase family enzyme
MNRALSRILIVVWLLALTAWIPPDNGLATEAVVTAVDSVGMTVSDLDRSIEFYSKVLSFEKVSETEVWGEGYEHLQGVFGLRLRVARLRLGDEYIELTEYLVPKGRPIPVDARSNDRWFQHIAIIVSDMGKAYQHLRRYKVTHASSGPQRLPDWNPNAGGIKAFYFKDPDGHALEILQFPPGKGNPKWDKTITPAHPGDAATSPWPGERLFLGIDHTAIVVSDTETSLKFYRDVLGMAVAGESENYGTEQEHLNNVFGARLHITALWASTGPGIEFLEYLTPRDGRPLPADARANDLLHWQTRFVAKDARAAAQALNDGQSAFVSSGVVTIPQNSLGFTSGLLVRDPDGHALLVIQK